jgi:hypothetical protein
MLVILAVYFTNVTIVLNRTKHNLAHKADPVLDFD